MKTNINRTLLYYMLLLTLIFIISSYIYFSNVAFASNLTSNNITVSQSNNISSSNTYNIITTFIEIGLPSNTFWSATYNNITQNTNTSNNVFLSPQGNYIFEISNVIIGNVVYAPIPSSGSFIAGNIIKINFTSTLRSTIVPSTKSATTTSAFPFNATASLISSHIQLVRLINNKITSIYQNSKFNKNNTVNFIEAMKIDNETVNLRATVPLIQNIFKSQNSKNITEEIAQIAFITNKSYNTSNINFFNLSLYSSFSKGKLISYTQFVPANIKVPIVINANTNTTLSLIDVKIRNNENNVSTAISFINNSAQLIKSFNKPFLTAFIINSTLKDSNVTEASYNFSVPKTWIANLNINPDQIVLYKYINYTNSWVPLPTYIINNNSSDYYYIAISNSLSTYLVSFNTNAVTTGTAGASSASITLPSGYRLYLCGAGANYTFATSGTAFTWTQDVGAPSGAPINNGENASIGHQSSNICTAYTTGATDPGLALAGIGINQIYYTLYSNATAKSHKSSLSYTVSTSNSFVVILADAGYYNFTAVTPSSSTCVKQQFVNNSDSYESAYVATCQNQASGSYTVAATTAKVPDKGSSVIAAYVFSPFNLILDDNIPNGEITTDGATYSTGSTIQVIGTNTVQAVAPSNFIFTGWTVSNTLNLSLSSTTANPSTLTVMGNGILTANYNGISNFIESGLPSGSTWNVVYDGILSSSTTNTITFSTLPGNYPFTIANQVISGTTYIPSPSSGYLVAGNTTSITFPLSCYITLTPNTINFGNVNPNTNIATINSVVDSNSGNANANMLVYGGNWLVSSTLANGFGVSNTSYASTSGVPYSSANKLSKTATSTLLTVPASGSNTIYFGLNIPPGVAANSYTQTITIENSC